MTKQDVLRKIAEVGLVPVVRAQSADEAMKVVDAICAGGVPILEITMTVPGALAAMEQVSRRFGSDVMLGAGTVRPGVGVGVAGGAALPACGAGAGAAEALGAAGLGRAVVAVDRNARARRPGRIGPALPAIPVAHARDSVTGRRGGAGGAIDGARGGRGISEWRALVAAYAVRTLWEG